MALTPSIEITGLLKAWGGGDPAAMERLAPLISDELRRMARHYMRGERDGHTLQATALVNEAWIRLVDAAGVNWQDRAHFFAVSAQTMRRILVDSARARRSGKRAGRRSGSISTTRRSLVRQETGNWWRWTMRWRLWPGWMRARRE